MMTTLLLPNALTSQPASGREMKKPTGRAKSTPPSEEAESLRLSWIVGMRDAQLAKHRPCIKNINPTAIRFKRGDTGCGDAESIKIALANSL